MLPVLAELGVDGTQMDLCMHTHPAFEGYKAIAFKTGWTVGIKTCIALSLLAVMALITAGSFVINDYSTIFPSVPDPVPLSKFLFPDMATAFVFLPSRNAG